MLQTLLKRRMPLVIVGLVTFFAIVLNNTLLKGHRLDLTENQLYTLSDGTTSILSSIEKPLTLEFFYSESLTREMPALRNYAERVKELLNEYVAKSSGKLSLEIVDPEPFSTEEDLASSYGLNKARVGNANDEIYFGLAAKGEGKDAAEVIEFFHPNRERQLEQDVSKLVYLASSTTRPKIGLISSLEVMGGYNFMTRSPNPQWMSFESLAQLYSIEQLSNDLDDIPEDIRLLVLVQPKDLSEKQAYAIDQFVLRGGNLMVFIDPMAEMAAQPPGMPPSEEPELSEATQALLKQWGIGHDNKQFVADLETSLRIQSPTNGQAIQHLALLGLAPTDAVAENPMLQGLEQVNFASVGAINVDAPEGVKAQTLFQSSDRAMLMDSAQLKSLRDPSELFKTFEPTGERYTLAAQLTGQFNTAFADGRPKPEPEPETSEESSESSEENTETTTESDASEASPESSAPETNGETVADDAAEKEAEKALAPHLSQAEKAASILVVADTDVLSDRLWVQISNFFGQRIGSPFAQNGDFFVNAGDTLVGNADLISVRNTGSYSRPFHVVDDIARDAELKFRDKEAELVQRLSDTESKLAELQANKEGAEVQVLSDEQKQALEGFQEEKLRIRKELRDVQHQLGNDIERLGAGIKLINIAIIPLLLTLLALYLRRRTQQKIAQA